MSATPKWVTIVMGAAVAATMLGACSATPAATPSPALTTAGSANPSNAAAHNEADTAFAQMMIVHHQGAIEMADLAAQQAQSADVQALAERPDNDTLLRLYALYKQGSDGDVSGDKPGFFDFVGTAKYEAWTKLKGTSQEEAQKKYVDLVKKLTA